MEFLISFAREKISENPHYKPAIIGLVQLAQDEIEDNECEYHEVELAINSIEELIEG